MVTTMWFAQISGRTSGIDRHNLLEGASEAGKYPLAAILLFAIAAGSDLGYGQGEPDAEGTGGEEAGRLAGEKLLHRAYRNLRSQLKE